jgi:predicted Zn finger-like uncharacterized protein
MILSCPECRTRFLVANHLLPPFGRTVKCGSCKHEWHAIPEDGEPEDAAPQAVDGANFEAMAETQTTAATVEEAATIADNEPDTALSATGSSAASLAAETDSPSEHGTIAAERGAERTASASPATEPGLPALIRPRIPTVALKATAAALALLWLVVAAHAHFYSWQSMPVLSSIAGVFGASNTDGLRFHNVTLTPKKQGQSTSYILSGNLLNESAKDRTVPLVRVRLRDADGADIWSREYALDKTLTPGETYPFRINNVQTTFGDRVARVHVDLGSSTQLMFR